MSNYMWFDGVVVVFLVIGLFVGRKHGISVELLKLIGWIAIVVAAGLLYKPLGDQIIPAPIPREWVYRLIYVFIALAVGGLFRKIHKLVGEKLVERDVFGKAEYVLGMGAGVLRFACMVLLLMSFLNARPPTFQEIAEMNKNTKDLEGVAMNPVRMQRDVTLNSITARIAHEYLSDLLIVSCTPGMDAPADTPAKRKDRLLDSVMNGDSGSEPPPQPQKNNPAPSTTHAPTPAVPRTPGKTGIEIKPSH
jgi:uncharacterized membrane protein required for colicin V production